MSRIRSSTAVHVDLDGQRGYAVTFAPLGRLPSVLDAAGIVPGRCVIITDEHVRPLYADGVRDGLSSSGFEPKIVTLPAGESVKSIAHLSQIFDAVLSWGIERSTPLIALGGGVVGDLAGFAAATLLRGIPLVHVPTSLIAQVDSSIGGKTGINHTAGKNLIGAFHQPRAVLADTAVLQSLPPREWSSGLAEVVKHGLIADEELVAELESGWDAVVGRDPEQIDRVVPHAAAIKALVVGRDELERGRRAILNFGHTFAHAIEKVAGYGAYTHGEAVAAGMRAALHLSGRVHPELDRTRADRLVSGIPLPPGLAGLSVSSLVDAMKADKKVRQGRIRFVLLDRIGHAYVTDQIAAEYVRDAWVYVRDLVG